MKPISDAASKSGSSQIITRLCAWCTNTQPQTVQQSENIRGNGDSITQLNASIPDAYFIHTRSTSWHYAPRHHKHCCGILQGFCIAIERKYPGILVKDGQHPSPYGLHCTFTVLEGMGHASDSVYLSLCDHQVHVLRGCHFDLDKNIKAQMVQWFQQ